MRRSQNCRGNALIEFTLVCIPLIFIVISLVELSRYMWAYHTLAYAVEKGARFAAVHGEECVNYSSLCPVTVAKVAAVIRGAATGLDSRQLNIVLRSPASSVSCTPLNNCLGNAVRWPPSGDNSVGLAVQVAAVYPFRSAMSIFWPGAGKARVATVNMGASAREEIRF